jgi:hypothetical protein
VCAGPANRRGSEAGEGGGAKRPAGGMQWDDERLKEAVFQHGYDYEVRVWGVCWGGGVGVHRGEGGGGAGRGSVEAQCSVLCRSPGL